MENITVKEMIIGLIVGLLVIAISVLINPWAMSFIQRDIRDKQRALQINESPVQFTYARDTKVGNVLAYGKMRAEVAQSVPELTGQFSIVEEITQEYTMHTNVVCDGYDKDGVCTGYHTEVSYSWDNVGTQVWGSPTYDYLGVQFQAGLMQLPKLLDVPLSTESVSAAYLSQVDGWYIYESNGIWDDVGDLRWSYNALPLEYNATMYIGFFADDLPRSATIYYEQKQVDVLEALKRREAFFNIAYYALILLMVESAYIWIAYNVIEVE